MLERQRQNHAGLRSGHSDAGGGHEWDAGAHPDAYHLGADADAGADRDSDNDDVRCVHRSNDDGNERHGRANDCDERRFALYPGLRRFRRNDHLSDRE
jgi:hypothetical protein